MSFKGNLETHPSSKILYKVPFEFKWQHALYLKTSKQTKKNPHIPVSA